MFSLLLGHGWINSIWILLYDLTFIFGVFIACKGSMSVCTSSQGNESLCPSMTCSFLLSNCPPLLGLFD